MVGGLEAELERVRGCDEECIFRSGVTFFTVIVGRDLDCLV